jgi:glycosyltransferase involved in cell wall biosynthesis
VAEPERRLRVVTLLDTLERVGGAETMALELCSGLQAAGHRSYLAVSRWSEAAAAAEPVASTMARLRSEGIEVVGLSRTRSTQLRPWRRLVRFLKRERIDVLHAHMFGSNAWGSVIGTIARTPVVIAHEHMWSFEGSATRRVVDRQVIARLADAFIAVSEDAREQMVAEEGIPAERIVVIRNGIAPLPAGDRDGTRRALGLPGDRPVVLSVGMLRPEKAFEVLVEAASRLPPEATVLIAGDGDERGRLEGRIGELGLGDRVRLLGVRRDVPDLLAAADVCVCCSDFEGGPLSVMEYMAAGKPVVATRVGGMPELVSDGETGALVPPRDPDALASAINALVADPGRRASMGERAQDKFEAELSLANALTDVQALYARLLPASGVG